jgi:hypothetical protein
MVLSGHSKSNITTQKISKRHERELVPFLCMYITKAYLRHVMVWAELSGQRRFVPRASTTVNYKIAPLSVQKNGGASRFAQVKSKGVKSKVMAGTGSATRKGLQG